MIQMRIVKKMLCIIMFFLAYNSFSQQISDFNTTFSYPCDNSYFNKGDSLFVFCKAGNASLQMRKIYPAGWSKNSRLPVIVMFFGGGWVGDCAPEFKWFKNYFISKGFVVLIADYVIGAPIEQNAIPDAKAAIRWVRQNADTLGVDPKKIISFGSSAGGHLAAAVGTVKGFELSGEKLSVSSRPNCIISLWPVMDLTKSSSNMTSVDPKLVSPAWALDDTVPPILVMTGSNDPYMSGVQQFNTNAASYKFEHQYKEYPNAGHDFGFRFGSDIDKGNAGEDSTIAWSMAFLKKHNLLPSSVSISHNNISFSPISARDGAIEKMISRSGFLSIEDNNTLYEIKMFSACGKLVAHVSGCGSSSFRFGSGVLYAPDGMYYVKVRTNNNIYTLRTMVSR